MLLADAQQEESENKTSPVKEEFSQVMTSSVDDIKSQEQEESKGLHI